MKEETRQGTGSAATRKTSSVIAAVFGRNWPLTASVSAGVGIMKEGKEGPGGMRTFARTSDQKWV
jgi:hypothetical protein